MLRPSALGLRLLCWSNIRRAGLCTEAAPPPEPMSERILTFMHRVVASGLIVASAAGLAFISYGSWEIYDRAKQRKRIKEKQEAEARTA